MQFEARREIRDGRRIYVSTVDTSTKHLAVSKHSLFECRQEKSKGEVAFVSDFGDE